MKDHGNEETEKMWESWKDFSLICPDYDGFELQGNSASMVTKYFSLEIKKCNQAERERINKDCALPDDIDNYYRDI